MQALCQLYKGKRVRSILIKERYLDTKEEAVAVIIAAPFLYTNEAALDATRDLCTNESGESSFAGTQSEYRCNPVIDYGISKCFNSQNCAFFASLFFWMWIFGHSNEANPKHHGITVYSRIMPT